MKVSGFTVIRNAEKMGYPLKESLLSLLPLVDELVIGIGQSDDKTKEIISNLSSDKIKTFDSFWDTSKRTGGLILSEKTNEALQHCSYDWCIYLQADEVLHEKDYSIISQSLKKYEHDDHVQGLLLDYIHFYGSYNVIATSRKWYRKEIRIIKKSSQAQSYKDAQGFRINNKRLNVVSIPAKVFHYGWVKPPQKMGQKAKLLDFWWSDKNKKTEENSIQEFHYDNQYGLKYFNNSFPNLGHPEVMQELLQKENWHFKIQRKLKDWKIKDLRYFLSDLLERAFNYRFGEYKPYNLIKNR